MKRIFVLGTMLSGVFQRRTTRNRAQGAPIKAGQNRSAGKVERASAMESCMTRRGSMVSVFSKQRGQTWRPLDFEIAEGAVETAAQLAGNHGTALRMIEAAGFGLASQGGGRGAESVVRDGWEYGDAQGLPTGGAACSLLTVP